MKKNKIIARVFINRANSQKLITVPKDSGIESGDFVEIRKVTIKGDKDRV